MGSSRERNKFALYRRSHSKTRKWDKSFLRILNQVHGGRSRTTADTSRLSIVSTVTLDRAATGFTILLFDIFEPSSLCRTMALVLIQRSRSESIEILASNGKCGLHRCGHVRNHWWHRAEEFVINTGPTGLLGAARPQPKSEESLISRGLQGKEEARRVTSHYVFQGHFAVHTLRSQDVFQDSHCCARGARRGHAGNAVIPTRARKSNYYAGHALLSSVWRGMP